MAGRMRIAVFTDNDFAKVNGVTTTLRALLRWAPPDIDVRVYSADAQGADEPGYLRLRARGMGIPFYQGMQVYFPSPWAYVEHARRERIDLVHLTTPGAVGLAALYTAWRLRLPIVGSFHTDLAKYTTLLSRSETAGRGMAVFLRWMYGRCDDVLVPSQATSAMLHASGVTSDHVIWQRGVDPQAFSPSRRSIALREQWGAAATTPVVMYAGRVSREKNLAVIMALDEALRRAGRDYRLVFVGDGPMRGEIEHALPKAIVVGSVSHERMGEYLASADVFAFPSRTDTAGNVVLEAQASGLPCVVMEEGGPKENVWTNRSAFVTTTDRAFVDAVCRLVADDEVRGAMASAARTYALTRDWPGAFAPLFATYRRLVDARQAADAMTLAPATPSDTA